MEERLNEKSQLYRPHLVSICMLVIIDMLESGKEVTNGEIARKVISPFREDELTRTDKDRLYSRVCGVTKELAKSGILKREERRSVNKQLYYSITAINKPYIP